MQGQTQNYGIPRTTEGTAFYHALVATIVPKDQSDRTSFRKMAAWLEQQVIKKRFGPEAYKAALALASEAKLPTSKNPAAVFTHAFKREFGYGNFGA